MMHSVLSGTELATRDSERLLRVVADPLRARIVALLAQEQLCTCHLVELTGARQTNVRTTCAPCGRPAW